ncbi:hypothetical protein [Aldersonia kunmingensis]|uniref:hypothetical protein n=1 Tax=Aldersonia kunmingensis TaxID=408066 RepID=UPI00082E8367|nr:hypothetical protein [Aldersonia kunmingensis]
MASDTASETTDNETTAAVDSERESPPEKTRESRSAVSVPVSTIVAGSIAAIAVLIAIVLGVLLWMARSDIADTDAKAADDQHAEQVATDYAVGAATIDFKDFDSWVGRLKAGTAPELANKFDATGPKLEGILTPLQWTSTATPIAAKVESTDGGIYKVDVFVNVSSTNAQNPEGAQTTVTYNVTLDKDADWKITDVGGVNAALPTK